MLIMAAPKAEEVRALFRRSLSCPPSIPHDVPEEGYLDDDDEHGDGDDEHGFDVDDDDDHHYLQWQGPSMRRWSW